MALSGSSTYQVEWRLGPFYKGHIIAPWRGSVKRYEGLEMTLALRHYALVWLPDTWSGQGMEMNKVSSPPLSTRSPLQAKSYAVELCTCSEWNTKKYTFTSSVWGQFWCSCLNLFHHMYVYSSWIWIYVHHSEYSSLPMQTEQSPLKFASASPMAVQWGTIHPRFSTHQFLIVFNLTHPFVVLVT